MAKGKNVAITQVYSNNAKAATTVSKHVEQVLVNGILVPDPKEIEPGVIMR